MHMIHRSTAQPEQQPDCAGKGESNDRYLVCQRLWNAIWFWESFQA